MAGNASREMTIGWPCNILKRLYLLISAEVRALFKFDRIMLTEQEANRIFSWQPYRDDWPIDRNQRDDNIEGYYGSLIKYLTQNKLFDTYYSEKGGLGNYLEFFCYPIGSATYKGNAILVCVSLCAPLAAYGQTTFCKGEDFFGWGSLFSPDKIGDISDAKLLEIEKLIRRILEDSHLHLIDNVLASRPLPVEVAENLKYENHNEGRQYLHGLFQKTD
jgi:hypothetical protein